MRAILIILLAVISCSCTTEDLQTVNTTTEQPSITNIVPDWLEGEFKSGLIPNSENIIISEIGMSLNLTYFGADNYVFSTEDIFSVSPSEKTFEVEYDNNIKFIFKKADDLSNNIRITRIVSNTSNNNGVFEYGIFIKQ